MFLFITPITGNAQQQQYSDTQKVVQMPLDFPVLQEHINSNEIIETDTIWFVNTIIRDNNVIPNNLNLYLRGRKLFFKKEKERDSIEDTSYEIKFNSFEISKNKASVEFEYCPTDNA